MDQNIQTLRNAFLVDNYDAQDFQDIEFIENFNKLCSLFDDKYDADQNPLDWLIEKIIEHDSVEALKLIFSENIGLQYDMEYLDNYFEEGDWFDKNEGYEIMADSYGEEGTQYYYIYTKTQTHTFSEDRPFPNGVDYVKSETQS
jgi:hypothetical protein